jgi:outer membrane protein OmpA-like peptidoglycan-associated protein
VADRTDDRSRRPAWLPLLGAAVLVPTVLAGLTQLWPRPQIEEQLTRAGGEALAAAGFPGAGLVLTGRDAAISGIDPADAQRAMDTVQGVTGIRIASVPETGPDAGSGTTSGPAPTTAPAPFGIARRGADIVLSGVVGSVAERTRLIEAADVQAGGRAVVDELTVTPGATLPAGVSPTSVEAAAAALTGAVGPDTAIGIGGDGIALTGSVADEAARNAAAQAVAAALPGLTLENRLVIDPALTAPGPAPDPSAGGAGGDLDAAAKQQLQGSITQLLSGAPITFQPNSPQLTAAGNATVARLLELVRAAPGARLQVDGFVATGPGNGRLTAQQLSEQRAAAVRDALAAGGVPAGNIVARGLGEGSSPAAQAAGRRVDITVI